MLYLFQAVPPPIIRSSKLYTQHWVFFELLLLLTACLSWDWAVRTHSCKQLEAVKAQVFVRLLLLLTPCVSELGLPSPNSRKQ